MAVFIVLYISKIHNKNNILLITYAKTQVIYNNKNLIPHSEYQLSKINL